MTQEEAKVAAAEHPKITHAVDGEVMSVDERVTAVGGEVQSVNKKVEDVDGRPLRVQGVDDKVQGTLI